MNTIENLPSHIDFGAGAVACVGERVAELGKSAFVVTDRGVIDAGLCERVLDALRERDVAFDVFGDVSASPTEQDVAAATDAFKASGHDVLLAIGGGSPMDVAKAVALMATHEGAASDYNVAKKGFERVEPGMPPVVAVPTTAGTGSEMSGAFVLSDPETHAKVVVLSPLLKPTAVVLDPELTLTMPPRLTAVTGMDALAHAIESYCVDAYNPFADAQAKEAIELIAGALCTAVADGQDMEARTAMLMAAALAGSAMSMKGLGLCHALAHQIDAAPHGLANAVLLPPVMRFNAEAAAGKLRRVAEIMGMPVSNMGDDAAALVAADAVAALRDNVGLEHTLTEIGCSRDDLDRMVRGAVRDMCFHTNPRRCRREELRTLLDEAMGESE